MNAIIKKQVCFWMMIAWSLIVYAQDSLQLSLPEAEKIFINNNLLLLAEQYNVSIAEAQVVQSRLYNNPTFEWDGNIYNPDRNKLADLSNRTGQYTLSVQQLVLLAGKRNKQISLATTNTQRAGDRLYELLRTLRYTLRSDFYQAYFIHNSLRAYDKQIQSMETLHKTYQGLSAKGTVTARDAVRIQSVLYSLRAEQIVLQKQFNDIESEIQLLLQNNSQVYIPVIDRQSQLNSVTSYSLVDLLDTAYRNRPDLTLAGHDLAYARQNLSLQKALAVPDLTIGAQFDKRGSFVDNATFFTMAIDLPFFNRNQGNIRAAKAQIDQSKLLANQKKSQVENEVRNAYLNALQNEKMIGSIDPDFRNRFEELIKQVTVQFERRNISLLEFVDFYDSYKQNILQLNQLENARCQAIEQLNFTIGKTILNY